MACCAGLVLDVSRPRAAPYGIGPGARQEAQDAPLGLQFQPKKCFRYPVSRKHKPIGLLAASHRFNSGTNSGNQEMAELGAKLLEFNYLKLHGYFALAQCRAVEQYE